MPNIFFIIFCIISSVLDPATQLRKLFVVSVHYFIVKRSSKIFENSFLKNGILEF